MESDQVKGFFGALISLNALVIAISADVEPDAGVWFVLEVFFVVSFAFGESIEICAVTHDPSEPCSIL